MKRTYPALLLVAGLVVGSAIAVGSSSAASTPPDTYDVTIARDPFGVPHITATDWGSLGFGQGYALAEDRACTLLDQIVKVRGERARWFGPGDNEANLSSDFAYRHLGIWEEVPQRWADQPERVQVTIEGFVAGFNAALDADAVSGWCVGEPWVAAITTQDLYAYIADILLLASSGALINEIGNAQPPTATTATEATTPVDRARRSRPTWVPSPPATPGRSAPKPRHPAAGCSSVTRTSPGRVNCGSGRTT